MRNAYCFFKSRPSLLCHLHLRFSWSLNIVTFTFISFLQFYILKIVFLHRFSLEYLGVILPLKPLRVIQMSPGKLSNGRSRVGGLPSCKRRAPDPDISAYGIYKD
jgi:hypothetical protein